MSLCYYNPKGFDFFKAEPQPLGELDFPCCVCVFRHRPDSAEPCCKCGHNVNAKQEEASA